MKASHVGDCYMMSLPTPFCDSYLPKKDIMITLVDENETTSIVFIIRAYSSFGLDWGFGLQYSKARVKRSTPQVSALAKAQLKDIDKAEQVLTDHADSSARKGAFANDDDDSVKTCAREQVAADHAESSLRNGAFTKDSAKTSAREQAEEALPIKFCASHLPKNDIMITLVDVKDEEYTVKYIVKALAVSAGWRIFVVAHKLAEGDALVFQLVEDVKFKVTISVALLYFGFDTLFSNLALFYDSLLLVLEVCNYSICISIYG
ncbi:hypothetical protein GIB67_010936, partial [Kingdonia uniflora]